MEKDDEFGGEGNNYTAEFWQYDPRLGRRWNIDPLSKHWESPYASFNNNPIVYADPTGLTGVPKQHTVQKGDNYWDLAKNSNGAFTANDLKSWNPGVDPKKLKVGQTINISDPNKALKLGSMGASGGGEDFESGLGGEATTNKGRALVRSMQLASDDALIGYARRIIKEGALLTENQEADKLLKHFADNTGKDYTSVNLSTLMAEQDQLKQLSAEIGASFKRGMALNNGNYSDINIQVNSLPSFSFSDSPTLKTFVGGTQQLDVWLTDIKVGKGGAYKATLSFTIYDDFGINERDFTNPSMAARWGQNAMTGLWILQKQRGYKGFRTKFTFKMEVNGNF